MRLFYLCLYPDVKLAGRQCLVAIYVAGAQISLMVRIKNTLTPAQQAKLAEIRSRMG